MPVGGRGSGTEGGFNQDHVKIDETLKALADKDLALESAMTTVAAAAGNCQMELITYTGTGILWYR